MQDLAELQIRDHLIGQIKNEFHSVLQELRRMQIDGGIKHQGELVSYKNQEAGLVFRVSVWRRAAERNYTQSTLPSGQRQGTGRSNAETAQKFPVFGETRLLLPIWRCQKFLRLKHPANGCIARDRLHIIPFSAVCIKYLPGDRRLFEGHEVEVIASGYFA